MSALTQYISAERLTQILDSFADKHIGVIGDVALDAYWYADMRRAALSRETPHYPRPITREVYAPGAGGTVAVDLSALGVGKVTVFSVFGDDWRGETLRKNLTKHNIDTSEIIIAPKRVTPAYIKPILMGYDSQQEDARLDFENTAPLTSSIEQRLIQRITRQLPHLDALLITDQFDANGVITDSLRKSLIELATKNPDKSIAVDSRYKIGFFSAMILKANASEAIASFAPQNTSDKITNETLAEMGKNLAYKNRQPVFITAGDDGVFAFSGDTMQHIPSAPVRPPIDIVGAGDSFFAAIGATLAANGNAWEASVIGNLAAAVSVEKLMQTGTASPQEILARYLTVKRDA